MQTSLWEENGEEKVIFFFKLEIKKADWRGHNKHPRKQQNLENRLMSEVSKQQGDPAERGSWHLGFELPLVMLPFATVTFCLKCLILI